MTGRDLIIYILQNNLENEKVFEDGRFLGFLTVDEFAEKHNVGTATVEAWIRFNFVMSINIGGTFYIPEPLILLSSKGVKDNV